MKYTLQGGPLDGYEQEVPDEVLRLVGATMSLSRPTPPLNASPDIWIEPQTGAIIGPPEIVPPIKPAYYVRLGGQYVYVEEPDDTP